MPPRPLAPPSYRLHRATGQARVTILGKDYYLGRHGSPASWEKYRRLRAECLSGNIRTAPVGRAVKVLDVLQAFLRHADTYYRRDSWRRALGAGHCRIMEDSCPRKPDDAAVETEIAPARTQCRHHASLHSWLNEVGDHHLTGLLNTELRIMLVLARHANWASDGVAYPSVRTIAQKVGKSARHIARLLRVLERRG